MENDEIKKSSIDEDFNTLQEMMQKAEEPEAPEAPEAPETIEAYYTEYKEENPEEDAPEASEKKTKTKEAKVPKNKKSKKVLIIAIIAVLVLAAAAAAWYFFGGTRYDVVFKDDSGNVIESIKVKEGKPVPEIEKPAKDGYIFTCWEYNGKALEEGKTVKSDMTLKAVFKKEISVNFCKADGSVFLQVKVGQGEKLKAPDSVPVENNKAFVEWRKGDSKIAFDFSEAIIEDMTLTAVMKDYIKAIGCAFSHPSYTVELKKTLDVHAVITPTNTTEKVIYKSSDETIFTVDEKGVVTGVKEGEAKLEAKCDGIEASTLIKVTEVKATDVQVKEGPTILLAKGRSLQLTCTVVPENTTNKELTFTSSAESIAIVDSKGNISGIGKGNCTISVKTSNGIVKEIPVQVFVPLESITLTPSQSVLAYDGRNEVKINAILSPADADVDINTIYWSAGNAGGQNGSYNLSVTSDKKVATLSGRENSRYDTTCQVYASLKNKDGSEVLGSVTIKAEPTLKINELYIEGSTYTNVDPSVPVEVHKGDSIGIRWNVAGDSVFTVNGVVGGPGGVSEYDHTGVVRTDPSASSTTFMITTGAVQILTLTINVVD